MLDGSKLLKKFLEEHKNVTCTLKNNQVIYTSLITPIVRIEDDAFFVTIKYMTAWCHINSIDYEIFIDTLEKQKILIGTETKLIATGTLHKEANTLKCLKFSLDFITVDKDDNFIDYIIDYTLTNYSEDIDGSLIISVKEKRDIAKNFFDYCTINFKDVSKLQFSIREIPLKLVGKYRPTT